MKYYKEDNNSVLIIGGAILFIVAVLLGGYLMNNRGAPGSEDTIGAADEVPDTSAVAGDVAIIDGTPLTRDAFEKDIDIILFLQGMPLEYKDMVPEKTLLNQSIVQEIIYRKAVAAGYSSDIGDIESEFQEKLQGEGVTLDEYKESLEGMPFTYDDVMEFYAKQKAMGLFLNETLTLEGDVTEEDAREFYDQNPGMFEVEEQVTASHILVNTSEEAMDLIRQLEEGADFADLARDRSTCPSAAEGGDLGTFGSGDMVPEFEDAAFALEGIGDFTHEPVETSFGYHIILLTGRTEAGKLSWEDVKDSIKEDLALEKRGEAINSFIQEVLAEADIDILI